MDYPYPKAESVELLGRTFSTMIGYSETFQCIPIPVGTRVKLMPAAVASSRNRFDETLYGQEAVVVGFIPGKRRPDGKLVFWEQDQVRVRLVQAHAQWEPYANYRYWHVAWVEILEVGTGEITPGSYELTQEEIWDERFARREHAHQGWSNPPTFLAQLYLNTESRHRSAMMGMVRRDGSINSSRLQTYFQKSGLHIDDWSWFPETFPESLRYRYRVNWAEIATFFADKAREHRHFSAAA